MYEVDIIFLNDKYSLENLTAEELTFIQLWKYFDKYATTFLNRPHFFNFSELKRLKIQQSLLDVDLKNLYLVLKSVLSF